MTDFIRMRAAEIRVGDYIDLEADKYADPKHDHDLFTYEYLEVCEVTFEYSEVAALRSDRSPLEVQVAPKLICIAIGFEGWDVCGFPPDHLLTVRL